MARPSKCRKVCCVPETVEFKAIRNTPYPYTEKDILSEKLILSVDEFETVRLIDYVGLSQDECSKFMEVARTTVQQVYITARKKIAKALVEGLSISIEGGNYRLCDGHRGHRGCSACYKYKLSLMENKGGISMRVLIPLEEEKKFVCQAFGRAPFFMVRDLESGKDEILENPAKDAEGGAGIKAAQFIVDNNVDAVITMRLGQNSADVFKMAEIDILKAQGCDIEENFKMFSDKTLRPLNNFHAGFHGIKSDAPGKGINKGFEKRARMQNHGAGMGRGRS